MDLDSIITKYNLSLHDNHKQYILSNNYTLIINGTKYYLIKSKLSLKCKNLSYIGEDLNQKQIIVQLTNHNLEYEDNLGLIYTTIICSSDKTTCTAYNVDQSILAYSKTCCIDNLDPDTCQKCYNLSKNSEETTPMCGTNTDKQKYNYFIWNNKCWNNCRIQLSPDTNCSCSEGTCQLAPNSVQPTPAPSIQTICDSSNQEWFPGMPLNAIGACESLENKIISSLDILLAGITYNGTIRSVDDCGESELGCCIVNAQNSQCITSCPLLSAAIQINNTVFPPTSEVFSMWQNTGFTKPTTIIEEDEAITCLENGNYWINSTCKDATTKYNINNYSKIDSKFCSNSNNNIMTQLAYGNLLSPNNVFYNVGYPSSNNPASAIITLSIWLAFGQNIKDKLYDNEQTNINDYKDIAYYLTKQLPMGRHSDGSDDDKAGGYLGEFYDDFEWWGMAKMQGLYSLINMYAGKKDDTIVKILTYEFIGVIRTCMYIWQTVDNVCGGGTLWQASNWNTSYVKSSITNLLLIYNTLAIYKFYYKYKNIDPFKTCLENLGGSVKINSKTTMNITDILSEFEKIVTTQFIWLISPIGDTSKVQGMLDNHPDIGIRGRVYDSVIAPIDTTTCYPPGVANLYKQYDNLWNSETPWQQSNKFLGNCQPSGSCSTYNRQQLCKANIPAQPTLSIGSVESPKCYVSWSNDEFKDKWPQDINSRTESTNCSDTSTGETGCNATTYGQGLFIAICCLLADTFKTNNTEPLVNTDFSMNYYDYNIFGDNKGKLVNLNNLSKDDAVSSMINLACTTAEFSYDNLSVMSPESNRIISDSDLARSCVEANGEDALLFRSIQAYGFTILIGTLENIKPPMGPLPSVIQYIKKYKDYLNNTANYIWNNTRNPLNNLFSQCYPGGSGFNNISNKLLGYSNEEAILNNQYSPKGHGSSTIIIQCQYIISSNNYSLLGVSPDFGGYSGDILPQKKTIAELKQQNSNWYNYIKNIYPSITDTDIIDISSFDYFYKKLLVKYISSPTILVPSSITGSCDSIKPNDLYKNMSGDHDPPDSVWRYQFGPYKSLQSNIKVEVTHCCSSGEEKGTWYYKATGSGIYLDLGKTISFNDHKDAVQHFLNKKCDDDDPIHHPVECISELNDLINEASKEYDTIQFLNHPDMQCNWNKNSMAMEILDIRLDNGASGKYNCGTNNSKQNLYRDWGGKSICKCKNFVGECSPHAPSEQNCLNCEGLLIE